jgi:hypothetical protein
MEQGRLLGVAVRDEVPELYQEKQMKTIAITTVLILWTAARCLGAGDPVSSVTKEENRETTTFQRDGKTILRVTFHHSCEPKRRCLRQTVIIDGQVVMEVIDLQGKREFLIRPNSHISVSVEQTSTGALQGVALLDDANIPIEFFEAKDSRLTPISGKQLEHSRAVTKDVSAILENIVKKKTTPEEFRDRVNELQKKYNSGESDNQEGKRSDDKPSPQNPSPQKKP